MDFEKEILEIEKKIQEIEAFAKEKGLNLQSEIDKLTAEKNQKIQDVYNNLSVWDKIKLARHPKRPYTLDYIENMVEDFVELHGDRLFADDNAIVGGIGKIDGEKFVIIGTQKGRDIDSNLFRNFGYPKPEGYRKALRLMRLAERFNIPVLTFIDTAGAYCGLEAEERGQGEAIARNLIEMAGLNTQIIAVVIGEGGSGGALALGVADRVFALENSYYSVISPEGCASILLRDSSKAPEAAERLKLDSSNLLELKIVEEIIPEPLGGAHRDYKMTSDNIKKVVMDTLKILREKSIDELKEERYMKFRELGEFSE
ncbi:MAG: acetyl-CoA carboxylase carboxyltransferase subunit alpha [Fusobacteriaceae bacterium]|nr:acetyl-CoA carboxylase carboxyltransferase subunit alpha [Fusobacteriaceae bacterium]